MLRKFREEKIPCWGKIKMETSLRGEKKRKKEGMKVKQHNTLPIAMPGK